MIISEKQKLDKTNPIYIRLEQKNKQSCEMLIEQIKYLLKKNSCESNISFSKIVDLLIECNFSSHKNILMLNNNLFTLQKINQIYLDDFIKSTINLFNLSSEYILNKLDEYSETIIIDYLYETEESLNNKIEEFVDTNNLSDEKLKLINQYLGYLKEFNKKYGHEYNNFLKDLSFKKKLFLKLKKFENNFRKFYGKDNMFSYSEYITKTLKKKFIRDNFSDFYCLFNSINYNFAEILELDYFKEIFDLAIYINLNIDTLIKLYVDTEFNVKNDIDYDKSKKILTQYVYTNFNKNYKYEK